MSGIKMLLFLFATNAYHQFLFALSQKRTIDFIFCKQIFAMNKLLFSLHADLSYFFTFYSGRRENRDTECKTQKLYGEFEEGSKRTAKTGIVKRT